MRYLSDIGDIQGKRVLLRTGLNVPLKDGVVANEFRLRKAFPTINLLREHGAKVILLGHIGRDPKETLKPVFDACVKSIPMQFAGTVLGAESQVAALKDGEVLMLENVRSLEGEEANDPELAKALAAYGEIYVNDAFSDSHREHASIVGIPKLLPSFVGLNAEREITELQKALEPESPALFMLGGAKFETKQPLIEKFIGKYDHVFVAGALANDLFKAKGFEVGVSLVSEIDLSSSPILSNPKLLLPVDVTVEGPRGVETKKPEEVLSDEKIVDCGPETTAMLVPYIESAKTILWNGPFGLYEKGFNATTEDTARRVAESSAHSIVGGGDTVASIDTLGLEEKISFVSTGGGAMLEFLEKGTLAGYAAMQ